MPEIGYHIQVAGGAIRNVATRLPGRSLEAGSGCVICGEARARYFHVQLGELCRACHEAVNESEAPD